MKFWQVAIFVLVQFMLFSGCSEDLVGADPWDLDENEEFSSVVPDVGEQDASPPDPTDSGGDGIPDVEDVDINPDVDASMEVPAVAQASVSYDPRVLLGQEKLNVTLSMSGGEPSCMVEGFEVVYDDGLDNLGNLTLDASNDFSSTLEGNTLKIELDEYRQLDGFEVTFNYITNSYGLNLSAFETNAYGIRFIPVLDREDCLVDQVPVVEVEFAAVDSEKGLEALDQYEGYNLNFDELQNGNQTLGILKIEADYWENRSKIGVQLDLVVHELNFKVDPGQGVDVYDMWIERLDRGDGETFTFTPSFNDDGDKVFGLDTFGDRVFEIGSSRTAYFLIRGGVTISADSDRKLKVLYEGGTFSSSEENTPYFSLEGGGLVSEFE